MCPVPVTFLRASGFSKGAGTTMCVDWRAACLRPPLSLSPSRGQFLGAGRLPGGESQPGVPRGVPGARGACSPLTATPHLSGSQSWTPAALVTQHAASGLRAFHWVLLMERGSLGTRWRRGRCEVTVWDYRRRPLSERGSSPHPHGTCPERTHLPGETQALWSGDGTGRSGTEARPR